ncbi:MAG: hypothetical protein IAI49_02675, partial [Candidatus Eremiobacteraeota bacterium]|nr:hypothetical protein [Candidatus Eremiobacteraeota bacterium]
MNRSRKAVIALLAGTLLIANTAPSLAKTASPTGRFSKAPIYTGPPALATLVALIVAGGGAAGFSSRKLAGFLAGDSATSEVASLQQKFGASNVASFFDVFDFVALDAVGKVTAGKVLLPPSPSPSPVDGGKALAANLYALGVDKNTKAYDVEYMLDALVTHGVHAA